MNNLRCGLRPFIFKCTLFSQKIKDKENELVNLLSSYETHETAHDEIQRSIGALNGMENELLNISKPLTDLVVSTFFPLNLPLYSLILFGVVPSAFSSHVFIRPPEIMQEILDKLYKLLEVHKIFPNIPLRSVPRHIFMELYASESDAIIFTGRYENALKVREKAPQALLLYNGSGVNPFIIFDNADLDLAVEKSVEMRCFNSGQDCAGPDAFFVPTGLANEYAARLQKALSKIQVGSTKNPKTKISKIMKETYIDQIEKFFETEQDYQKYGGRIDKPNKYVYPAIFHKPARLHAGEFHEFFAPVFYVLEYSSDEDLKRIIDSEHFRSRAMYVSIFGDNPNIEKRLNFVKILKNKIVNDVEQGNDEYGGWGATANFLLYGNQKIVQPVLISRDMHKMLRT